MIYPAQIIDAVTHYLSANAPRIRGEAAAMPWDQLRTAVAFHALQGTLRVEWDILQERTEETERFAPLSPRAPVQSAFLLRPVGVAIVWQTNRAELEEREKAGKPAFEWQASDPNGDCLYLNLVITTAPGVMPKLAAWFRSQFPPLPEFAHRRNKLVRFHWLDRMGKAESTKQKVEIYG